MLLSACAGVSSRPVSYFDLVNHMNSLAKRTSSDTSTFCLNCRFRFLIMFAFLLTTLSRTAYVVSFLIHLKYSDMICKKASFVKMKLLKGVKYNANLQFTCTFLTAFASLAAAILWLLVILVLSGDIHPNPGPQSEPSSSLSMSDSSIMTTLIETIDPSKHLSFVHYNVQSIYPKLDILQSELHMFDILGFSETWLSPAIATNDLLLDTYSSPERKDRDGDSHGGLLLYVKDTIHFKRRTDLEPHGIECLWIELFLKSKRILFGLYYRPPNANRAYDSIIEDSFNLAIDSGYTDIIITGDFNLNCSNAYSKRMLTSLCEQFSLTQLIDEPTHYTETSTSILDIIFTRNANTFLTSGVGDPFLDQPTRYHCPIFGIFNLKKPKTKSFTRTVWNYENGDYDKLRALANSTEWDSLYDPDVNKHADNFTNHLIAMSEKCIYKRNVTIKPSEPKWINNNIKKQIRKRKRAYKKAKRTNQNIHWQKFRNIRNQTTSMIRKAKDEFVKNTAVKLKSNNSCSRSWWKCLKSFISSSNHCSVPPLKSGDHVIEEDADKADVLNTFFYEQTLVDDDNIEPDTLPLPDHSLSNIILTPDEVKHILHSLPLGKATGPDAVNNRVLREISTEISVPLCSLFNNSLRVSNFPTVWKQANVCPIFKSGDHSLASNYRPISLLSTIGKVFERSLFKHLFNYLCQYNIIAHVQSGFTPGDSSVNQLTYLYNHFCQAVDSGLEVRAVFCDISKAFDRVWHKGLIMKLKASGVTGDLLDWFKSYLTDRKQRVVLNGSFSSWKVVKAGVPQGSILGPLLFLIYINDIVVEIGSNIRLFADDTSLYIVTDDPTSAAANLNHDISTISNWADKWLVKFNPTKTESLIISRRNHHNIHPPLHMNNILISEVDSHKHLGLYLSNDLTWHKHIEYIKNKAWGRINIMRKLKYTLDRKSLETIYKTFIRPILEYGDVVFDNCSQHDKYELEKIQNEAARIVTGTTKLISIHKLLKEVGWESLENRRRNHKLSLMYKMIHHLTPNYLSELIPDTVGNLSSYNLRNANNIQMVPYRTSHYSNSFLPSTIRDWNDLSENSTHSNSLSSFRQSLRNNTETVPEHFYHGNRYLQALHTRLRTNCSSLNNDLYSKNMIDSPLCTCGLRENTHHYFLKCNKYHTFRQKLISDVSKYSNVTLSILLYGNPAIGIEDNKKIVEAVQKYILDSKRFKHN